LLIIGVPLITRAWPQRQESKVRRTGNRRGFTLIEITVVLAIAAVGLGMSGFFFSSFLSRTAARRAAQVFSRDLAEARAFSARSREWVVVRFREDSLAYEVESQGGRNLVRRRFQRGEDIPLSGLDLELAGDSVLFNAQGLADLSGDLGRAAFVSGSTVYEVRFNATGSSRVAPR
jgi:prepilin-type N-terminal cleavage/methylation domain-containing protein